MRWLLGLICTRTAAHVAALVLALSPVISAGAELADARKLYISGLYSNCAALCREAISDYVYQEEWHELLVRSEFNQGRYELAGLALSNALQKFSWSLPLRLAGREVFPFTSQSNRAAEMLVEIESMVGNRVEFRYRDAASVVALGRAALILNADPRRVLDNVFEQARKQSPESREPYLAIGDLALDKHDYTLASKQLLAALKKFPDDPDIHFRLARAYQSSDRGQMIEHAEAALKENTNHSGALLLIVDHLVDGEEYDEAEKLIARVLRINPWQPEAWGYRAVIQHVRNDAAGESAARSNAFKFFSGNAPVEHLIGRKLSQKYRFAEGAACQRRALGMDTNSVAAKAQLAQDLLRLGDEDEGWRLAEEARKQDEYDVTLFNLVTLKDNMRRFATLTNEHFVLRMARDEAPIYGEQALRLLGRARRTLSERYGVTLPRATTVEIFPEQRDFGVRTFGMPDNPGFLGVCFGPVITANSPASQAGHPANWQAVLWHEFTHAITLHLTRNKMPRWLSEGISVYEELRENPAWGQRMNWRYREMVLNGELKPIADLSSAFLAPKTPLHLQFAYYESALVVEFIVDRFGDKALARILADLGQGSAINEAITKHTAPMDKLEKDFAVFAGKRAESLAPGLDWRKPSGQELRSTTWLAANPTNFWGLQRQARDFIEKKKWKEARAVAEKLVSLHPTETGDDSPWLLLADAERGLGNTNAERSALERLAAADADSLPVYERLMELCERTGDWVGVRLNAERYLAVNPLVPRPHRALAKASKVLKQTDVAIRENRVLLRLDPPNPAEVHFNLAKLLHASGDKPAAKREVLQALEEAPRYREAHRLLQAMP